MNFLCYFYNEGGAIFELLMFLLFGGGIGKFIF